RVDDGLIWMVVHDMPGFACDTRGPRRLFRGSQTACRSLSTVLLELLWRGRHNDRLHANRVEAWRDRQHSDLRVKRLRQRDYLQGYETMISAHSGEDVASARQICRSMSVSVRIPTTRPPSTTGSDPIFSSSMRCAACISSSEDSTVITDVDMTSATRTA